MRKLVAVALAALSFGIAVPLNAAREEPTKPLQRLELLVIEVAGCTVCDLVRVHIQPAYESSPRARQVPLRYVDITSRDELEMGLAERVETVPTIVLMRDGREVDRISGYMGPENFFAALGQMLELAATD
jgi:thioredoxin-related protein